MSTGVVLLAAGASRRFGNSRPKQFQSLDGEPLFIRPLRVFARLSSIKEIALVVRHGQLAWIEHWISRSKIKKPVVVVEGGPFRGDSVRRGYLALSTRIRIILIHDVARALVTPEVIRRVEIAARSHGAALAAWPLPDTLKLASSHNTVKKTIPRQYLWLAQTPQGFRRDVAENCLLRPDRLATDDAQLAEKRGYKVALVHGSPVNFKVTVPQDLKICRLLASERF